MPDARPDLSLVSAEEERRSATIMAEYAKAMALCYTEAWLLNRKVAEGKMRLSEVEWPKYPVFPWQDCILLIMPDGTVQFNPLYRRPNDARTGTET